jgi:hypothetical protein
VAEQEYWFARYRVKPNEGRGLRPLSWKGRAVIAGFVLAMIGGGVAFLLLGLAHLLFAGIAVFVICAFGGAATFIWAAVTKSDPVKTVADYQAAGVLK